MPIPILAAAAGLLGAGLGFWGSERRNKQEREAAREQMAFQERMSSTAAQRSMEDYQRAGLNPALAYSRTASTPGGAMPGVEDSISKSVSSGQQAVAFKQAIQQQKENIRLTQEQQAATRAANQRDTAASELSHTQAQKQFQDLVFASINQPLHTRMAAAEALITELQIPGAKNTADWETMVGKWGRAVGPAASAISSITSLGRLMRAGKGVTNITRNITPTTINKTILPRNY